jgi:hypothetical protein
LSASPDERAEGPDWDKIRAYGRGEIRGEELTDKEMDLASDALDALDWADSGD